MPTFGIPAHFLADMLNLRVIGVIKSKTCQPSWKQR